MRRNQIKTFQLQCHNAWCYQNRKVLTQWIMHNYFKITVKEKAEYIIIRPNLGNNENQFDGYIYFTLILIGWRRKNNSILWHVYLGLRERLQCLDLSGLCRQKCEFSPERNLAHYRPVRIADLGEGWLITIYTVVLP